MLTKSDVEYAYRMILGREPETAEVVENKRERFGDVAELRRAFFASAEFREKAPSFAHANFKPLNWPALQIETTANQADLAAMIGQIESVWSVFGESDPHWSVLTSEIYRAENIEVSKKKFYETGNQALETLKVTASRCGVNLPEQGRCLELGCGVGRVTLWLAKRFAKVTAVDISAPHLALADAHLKEEGVTNVTWARLNKLDAMAKFAGFDLFFSTIALQHNPPPIMAILLRDALSALAPGGVAYFQIPTYIKNYAFKAEDYLKKPPHLRTMEMHALPQPELFGILAECGCRVLEIREDAASVSPDMVTNSVFAQRTRAS